MVFAGPDSFLTSMLHMHRRRQAIVQLLLEAQVLRVEAERYHQAEEGVVDHREEVVAGQHRAVEEHIPKVGMAVSLTHAKRCQ